MSNIEKNLRKHFDIKDTNDLNPLKDEVHWETDVYEFEELENGKVIAKYTVKDIMSIYPPYQKSYRFHKEEV